MSGPTPHGALQLAEWQAMAQVKGVPLAHVAGPALRDRMGQGKRQFCAGEVWADIPVEHRTIALSWATQRQHVDGVRWDQLTDSEQCAVGAFLRGLAKTAQLARGLK
jgi:hypothetical protein